MIESEDVWTYIQSVPKAFDAMSRHAAFMRLMCRCLKEIEHDLPDPSRKQLEVAWSHWMEGREATEELDRAKEQYWQFVLPTLRTGDRSRETLLSRAVLCVMYRNPEGADFDEDTLWCFIDILNAIGDYANVVKPLLVAKDTRHTGP